MSSSVNGQLVRKPELSADYRYLVVFLDNSPSTVQTKIGGESLFSLQVSEANRTLKALKAGKLGEKTWVLLVSFNGVLSPGWQPLEDVPEIEPSAIAQSASSPVLDMLGGVFDAFKELVADATEEGVRIRCAVMIATDGLDGVEIDSTAYPVSCSRAEHIRPRIADFTARGFQMNALAMGADGGKKVASFFRSLGLEDTCIIKSGLDRSALLKAFDDHSRSSLRGLLK
jgi:hypothetical protein